MIPLKNRWGIPAECFTPCSTIIYRYHYHHHPGPLNSSIGRRILGIITNAGKPNPAEILSYISQALMVAHPEQFPNLVVLIGETISFFLPVELGGYFYPPFFCMNIVVEPSAGSAYIAA
jgi:hypothetical protein